MRGLEADLQEKARAASLESLRQNTRRALPLLLPLPPHRQRVLLAVTRLVVCMHWTSATVPRDHDLWLSQAHRGIHQNLQASRSVTERTCADFSRYACPAIDRTGRWRRRP